MFIQHYLEGKTTILIEYVNDIILTEDDLSEMNHLKKQLTSKFEIKDFGRLKYFLSMEVARSSEGIIVSQRKYVLHLRDADKWLSSS